MEYLVVYEKSKTGWAAYVPDLPGCVATAPSRSGVSKRIIEAIKFHLEGLREMGKRVPKGKTEAELIEV